MKTFSNNSLQISILPLPVMAKVSSLMPYEGNARTHSKKQIQKIAASITEFGFMGSILADGGGQVIAGHGRLAAAQLLGMSEVPVTFVTHLTPAQARAYRITDNKLAELSGWSPDLLKIEFEALISMDLGFNIELTGFDTAEIDIILDPPSEDQLKNDPADEVPETGEAAVSQTGDIWQLGKHRLMCGSALDPTALELLMAGVQGDMAFVDMPYNVPIAGHVCGLGAVKHREFAMASGEMSEAQFTEFLTNSFAGLAKHSRDGAILFACMDFRHIGELLTAARATGLAMINLAVWNKSNGGMGSLYRSKHELVFVLKKGSAPHTNNVQLGRFGRYRTNIWNYAGVNSFGRNRMEELESHPTVKPVALVADAIRDVSNRGEIVLDLFMGSGTTLLAAERTGRIAYGTEIDPIYVDLAVRRWEKVTGKTAHLEATGESFADVAQSRSLLVDAPAAAA